MHTPHLSIGVAMRVGMYYSNKDVRVEEMALPKMGAGEILMRVETCGICGTDVLEWYRRERVPLVLGHEVAGTIEEVGEGPGPYGDAAARYKKGQRISTSHHVPCNTCHYCLRGHHTVCETLRRTHFDPGGFAEYLKIPAINVDRGIYVLPDAVSFEEATFIEPLACVLRGQRLAGLVPGESVLVLGCGVAGLLHIQAAAAGGAGCIIASDVSDFRLKAAERSGADLALNAREDIPKRLRQANDGRLADLVVICTGASAAYQQALKSVERGGTILFFAATDEGVTISLSINDIFWRNEIRFVSSYAGSPTDHVMALELIRSRRVRVRELITHRLSLSEIGLGFRLVAEARECLKVIINPDD